MQTFAEANKFLAGYVSPAGLKGVYTLGRMKKLMAALGDPQDRLKVIHVAGTSGKTSTSYYLTSLLMRAGKKIGLTVSPHVDEVNERIQINLTPLPEAEFCRILSEFIKLVEATGIKPTYFELIVAMAYWYFAKEKVDYAVVEVGLGGLLDGTNVVNREDKICVITDIGLDHTEILGESLSEIAHQKAGIIKPGNGVFTLKQSEEVLAVLKAKALEQKADLVVVQDLPDSDHELDMLPLFQRRNWWLAFTVFDHLAEIDGLPTLNHLQMGESLETYIPARMEVIKLGEKTVVLDGAHNGQKMRILAGAMREKFGNQPIAALVAIKDNPDFKKRTDLSAICKPSKHIIATGFRSQQDFPVKSVHPSEVAGHCRQFNVEVEVIEDPKSAMRTLLDRPEPVLLVTGSFYLMNHIRPLLGLGHDTTYSGD